MKNDVSFHNLSVEAGTGQDSLEVIGSKWSYALKWYKPNNDDDDDDDDDNQDDLADWPLKWLQ